MRHLLHNLFVLFSKDLHKTKNSHEEQREVVEHKEQCSQQNLDDVDVSFLFLFFIICKMCPYTHLIPVFRLLLSCVRTVRHCEARSAVGEERKEEVRSLHVCLFN